MVVPSHDYCLLPCTVVYVGKEAWFRNLEFLSVHWEANLGDDRDYHSLLDSDYWHGRRDPIGFSVPYSHCRRHPHSSNSSLVADCSLRIGACSERLEDRRKFEGQYRCSVQHRVSGYKVVVTSSLRGEWTG